MKRVEIVSAIEKYVFKKSRDAVLSEPMDEMRAVSAVIDGINAHLAVRIQRATDGRYYIENGRG